MPTNPDHTNRSISASLLMLLVCLLPLSAAAEETSSESRLRLIFLGDNGHHQPARRAGELMPYLASRGIDVQYTDDIAGTLTPERLSQFDGLILYANIDQISDEQADALLDYVAQGGGFIPLHCASYCFRNNEEIVALIGAQFQRHGTGTFTVLPSDQASDHPIMKGYHSFQSWDETYVHTKHNERNRTVLEYRAEGDGQEPWTWIRTHGKGRVFYTAWGHDQRTFTNPGFQNLVERGIRWACGADPADVPAFQGSVSSQWADLKMTELPTDLKPFEYIDVGPKIPNYVSSTRWGQQEAPKTLMQKPLDPAESMKHYVVPEGFKLELFAAEPDIGGKPICMNWDERGRLWVAETYDYPNEKQPEGQGRDRIRICEDTDGDGKADKFTVFAERLSIPTSIAFSHGGVVVTQAPDTLFFQDTDGDDVADLRKVLFTGWSTSDTHAGPSNLNYGHDNWFYGMVGYAGFEGKIGGQTRSFRTGFYRFKIEEIDGDVEVTDFEFLRNTDNNSWGVGFSEEGLLFGSTANRNPSEFMPVANRYYERVRGWSSSVLHGIADTHLFHPITDKIRQVDHHGGYTAAAGHALYTARRYPSAYWNRTAFVAGPTGHLVGIFALERQGAGYKSGNPANLLASDDEWAAPIMAEVGPDGNVWVIDWYNYIVQHNPTPIGFETGRGNAYMTDLRDKKHGRVYRVVYDSTNNTADEPRSLQDASGDQLVAALSSTNMFWRRHAQRLIVQRGDTSIAPSLVELVERDRLDSIGLDVAAIHALRCLDGLGLLASDDYREIVNAALSHPSSGVVRTAVEVMPRDSAGRDALLGSNSLESTDAQVRLAALLALADMPPSAASAAKAIEALNRAENRSDRWIRDAATSAAATNGGDFLVAVCQQPEISAALAEATSVVAEHIGRSSDKEAATELIAALAGASPEATAAILAGLAEGWPRDAKISLNEQVDASLVALLERLPTGSKGQLIRLGRAWGSEQLASNAEKIADTLLDAASDEDESSQVRIDAAAQLIELMDEDADIAQNLLDSITPQTPKDTAVGIIESLRGSRAEDIGDVLLDAIRRLTPATRTALVRVMLARPETTSNLLAAIGDGQLSPSDLTLDQQQSLLSHPSREIRERARRVLSSSGGLPSPDREKVLASLMKVTHQTGDKINGKALFVKNCSNCHTHLGIGTAVGPDLSGMAVHPKEELLTQIIDPSRSVEGNYRSYTVLTLDGLVINGMLSSETQTTIEMIDSEGKKHVVLREDIDQLVASKKSVMPEGFEKQMDEQGFTDLLEFLTSKGKYLPLPFGKVATAISTKGLFHEGDNGPDRIVFDDWSPKYVGDVPFLLIDPKGQRVANIVLLNGPRGTMPPKMPRSVRVPCNSAARAIHLLSGVSGWGYPAHQPKSVSMTVRLHLADGSVEDHPLINGVHFADYIRRVDVPESEFAMRVRGQQLRHLVIRPNSNEVINEIEFVKGNDPTSPIVVAATVETAE